MNSRIIRQMQLQKIEDYLESNQGILQEASLIWYSVP